MIYNSTENSFLEKISLSILCTFLVIGVSFSQQKVKTPKSIYTYSSIPQKNSFYALNKKLNLRDFTFVYVDLLALDVNQFLTLKNNFGKTPSSLIYDDFKAYRDEYLLKGFRLENDPTRWNLQCPSPLSVQPTVSKN